ncbi:dUTP diphosphatase [Shouchella clausii]|uniref:dUTP diphosphatase n=1 Tax=Shouchella clausii TaxID=79880 RepID=UPI000BA772B9|nr:deoxyuridine 5'-triphosphate nucleotidohydrolase [Shouchella clausii]PAD19136.1 deoxyuridine 5'-triphosphate nucleotidohydrolase [Shouchella clausii]
MNVKVKRLHPDAVLPRLATVGSAGFDLYAVEDAIIEPGETTVVKTGLAFELPPGYEMQIRPRSGITSKTKLRVQLGTVGADYRGEVGVIVDNVSERAGEWEHGFYRVDGGHNLDHRVYAPIGTHIVRKGDRIAQAVIQRLPSVEFTEAESLGDTERGAGGFGSTGAS